MVLVFKVCKTKYFSRKVAFNEQLAQLYLLCHPSVLVPVHCMLIDLD